MSRRVPPPRHPPGVAEAVRAAFEPRYGRPLSEDEVGEIQAQLTRLHEVLAAWDTDDHDPTPTPASSAPTLRSGDST